MSVLKILSVLFSALNLYFGIYFLLNILGISQDSKYSPSSNIIFTLLFGFFGIYSLYLCFWKGEVKLSFWLGFAPWVLGLAILFITMITSDTK